MYFKCCVRNCNSTREDAILHKFPAIEKQLNKWLKCISGHQDMRDRPIKNLFVCHKHFEKRFMTDNKSRLHGSAYPTLFTTNEILSGLPEKDTENWNPQTDHSYSRKRHYDHSYSKDYSYSEEPAETKKCNNADQNQFLLLPSSRMIPEVKTKGPESTLITSGYSSGAQKRHYDHNYSSGVKVQVEGQTSIKKTKYSQPSIQPTIYQDSSSKIHTQTVPLASPGKTVSHCDRMTRENIIDSERAELIPSTIDQQEKIRAVTPTQTENVPLGNVTTPKSSKPKAQCTTKKSTRKKIVQKLKNLTPMCKKIYREYNRAKVQSEFYKRAKRALKFAKEVSFEKRTKDLNPHAKRFMEMQINLCTKKKKGRRFSLDEKLLSLSIMKQSPKCYRFLHKIFILPSTSTLRKMVSGLDIEAGINVKFFQILKKEVSSWQETKKYCSIIFDEMSLETGLSYDKKKDKINGFVELGERKCRFADHVLVFMARGSVHKWAQTMAYYFCEGATSGPDLKNIIKDVVTAVSQAGLKPIVLACDQGSAFQSALKSLQADTRGEQLLQNINPDDAVIIGDSKMQIIFDPSHLIKGIRNNFLCKNINYNGKISTWQDIVDVYERDSVHTEMRLLHKLQDQHVIPGKIKKMKVKNCVRVLSKTVAAALSYTAQFSHYVDGKEVSKTLKNTAEIVSIFDDLFDSVNGTTVSAKKAKGKILRTAVRDTSKHLEFWRDAVQKLKKIRFVNQNGDEKWIPSLKNFIKTLKSYMKLWQMFKNLGLKIMRPRYFNTDPIENYFGQVRAYNYRNTDPTCHNFMVTYKSLTITRVIQFHSESFNCEDDSAEQFLNIKDLFTNQEAEIKESEPSHPQQVHEIVQQARRERLNVHSRAYTTGWVVKKIVEKISCGQCRKSLSSTQSNPINNWINHREFKDCVNKRKLIYPSETAVRCFGTILAKTNEFLEQNAHVVGIANTIKRKLESENSFVLVDCAEHQNIVKDCFLNITIRFGVHNWCNIINNILKGVDISRLKNKDLPNLQKLALLKYNKKLKNKSFNK